MVAGEDCHGSEARERASRAGADENRSGVDERGAHALIMLLHTQNTIAAANPGPISTCFRPEGASSEYKPRPAFRACVRAYYDQSTSTRHTASTWVICAC